MRIAEMNWMQVEAHVGAMTAPCCPSARPSSMRA